SPSMDIQIASNFERYLYYLRDEDSARVKKDMEEFAQTGRMDLAGLKNRVAKDFISRSVSEEETIATIAELYKEHDYLLDPHTAVGVKAAQELADPARPVICLSTAHPAKFGDAVQQAIGKDVDLPPALANLDGKESRCEIMDADVDQIKEYVLTHSLT
ncbi:MAG: threonine synthase, partial [Desulfobulbaceae bacterium]|nr:threonine synthase [Desulfobulbaceae bacterium]